ncbi:MAG: VanZ family protein [Bacilli bacterium]|nr:VanZ family protein [Bacilli bacterium]
MIKKIIKLFFVLIIMVTIFIFSGENDIESTGRSDGLIIRTCEFVLGRQLTNKEKDYYLENYVVYVRKTAHFTLYFLLGLAFISFLKEFDLNNKKLLIYTILFVFIYACSDEIHQLFIRGRSGEILDVLIDTLGGITSSFIYTSFIKRRRLNG